MAAIFSPRVYTISPSTFLIDPPPSSGAEVSLGGAMIAPGLLRRNLFRVESVQKSLHIFLGGATGFYRRGVGDGRSSHYSKQQNRASRLPFDARSCPSVSGSKPPAIHIV